MLQAFTKYAGIAQTALGVLGAAAPGVSAAVGTATGGNIFNILSGAALSYLGFKGTGGQQQTGSLVVGGLNALVGILGAAGITSIAGFPLSGGLISNVINIGIGAWGLLAGFMTKKSA